MEQRTDDGISPYSIFSRDQWAALREDTPMTLTPDEVTRVRSLHDRLDMKEVEEIYLPISRLLSLYVAATQRLFIVQQHFLGTAEAKVPYIIGVAGSVAVGKAIPYVSDFFDFSVYIDAEEEVLQRWYVDRFLTLRETAFRDPKSYFHRYSKLDDRQAVATATSIWERINLINLRENILPTRRRAHLILKKEESHLVQEVALRKL